MSYGYSSPLSGFSTHSETGCSAGDALLEKQRRIAAADAKRAALEARAANAGRDALAQHYWEQEQARLLAEQERVAGMRARAGQVVRSCRAEMDADSFSVSCASIDEAIALATKVAKLASDTGSAACVERLIFTAPDGAVQTAVFSVKHCGFMMNRACVTGV